MSSVIPKTVGNYQVVYKMGSGSFSEVYQGFNSVKGQRVALKFFDRKTLEDQQVLKIAEKEIRMAEYISHKNIIGFKSVCFLPDFVVLVMECLGNGTLTTMKELSICKINDDKYLKWGKDILEGINYLHKKGICHHDIKPDNIGFDEYMTAKIIDLGFCEECNGNSKLKCGTPLFTAPEVLFNQDYDGFKADIWSFGVTFHYLITGELPFVNNETKKQINCPQDFKNIIINKCKGVFKEIVDLALVINPKKRASAEEILSLNTFQAIEAPQSNNGSNNSINSIIKRKSGKNFIVSPQVKTTRSSARRISDAVFSHGGIFK